MPRNLRLLIAYDGTSFHGWQRQPGLRTVQGVIEESAARVFRHPIDCRAAGRTDAGVHAAGQVANIRTGVDIAVEKLRGALGARLPSDIEIRRVDEVGDDFDATQSAISKLYRYTLYATTRRPVGRLRDRFSYHYWHPLELDRVRAAARHFVGEHDFAAMASAGSPRETTVRTIISVDVHRRCEEVSIDIEGTGFLYNQVRNMVGTLLEIGRGRWTPDRVPDILASGDRQQAGPTAPAQGLCLQWVRYDSRHLQAVRPASASRSLSEPE